MHQLVVDLLAAPRYQHRAVRRQATHRFVDETGRHAERRTEGGAIEPVEEVDGVIEQADQRERRMEDEPASDQRVGDGWICLGGVEQDSGRADGAGRQDDFVCVDGDGNAGIDPEVRRVNDRVAVLGPRRRRMQPHAGRTHAAVVEENLVDDRVGNEAERVLAVGDGRVDELAGGIQLVVDRRRRIADGETVQVIQRRVDAIGGRAVPERPVVVVELAFGKRPGADGFPHPVVGGGEPFGRIGAVHQPIFDPGIDAGLDRRLERRKGEVDIDGGAAAKRLAAADDDRVVGRRREVAFVHEAGIASCRHRTPDDERAFFDQDDALAGGLKLARHGRAAGAAANHQVIDRSIAMRDRLLRSVVDQLAGSDVRRIHPGIDVGAIDEHGWREESARGSASGKSQIEER